MIPLVLTGRLGSDPELRFTKTGVAMLTMRLATSKRIKDQSTGQWSDGPTTWITAVAWDSFAEQIAETALAKGTEVIASGELQERSWTAQDGSERSRIEMTIRALGPTITGRQKIVVARGIPRESSEASFDDPDLWATN